MATVYRDGFQGFPYGFQAFPGGSGIWGMLPGESTSYGLHAVWHLECVPPPWYLHAVSREPQWLSEAILKLVLEGSAVPGLSPGNQTKHYRPSSAARRSRWLQVLQGRPICKVYQQVQKARVLEPTWIGSTSCTSLRVSAFEFFGFCKSGV